MLGEESNQNAISLPSHLGVLPLGMEGIWASLPFAPSLEKESFFVPSPTPHLTQLRPAKGLSLIYTDFHLISFSPVGASSCELIVVSHYAACITNGL